MLTTATKRKIDTARDILVGKIPVPTAQVEQITLALIYKFMSDMDEQARKLGDATGFFANGYEKYAWDKLMDKALPARDRVLLYRDALEKMSLNPHIPQLFRDVFKNASLPFNDPETLKLFLDVIDQFEYDHSEELGNAFEYLLQVMGSQGDAGQFRTPRHIIDFIVEVVDPKKMDKILDPACGTAGFLISAYKHLQKQGLSTDEMTQVSENVVGYDISQDMQRLSLVNMYLHHFPNPHIYEYDTLTSDDRWDDDFDVVLANPPFMTPKGGIRPHNRFSISSKRAEVLFVDYIAEHLTTYGRAGVIVPEGIVFKDEEAYKHLRKQLIESNVLWAVVSLPAGIFNPYTDTKTCILFFDKKRALNDQKVHFFTVKTDGYDLGMSRAKLPGIDSDIPIVNKLIASIKNGEKVSSRLYTEVDKETIVKQKAVSLFTGHYFHQNSEDDALLLNNILIARRETISIKDTSTYKRITVKLYGKGVVLRDEISGSEIKTKKQFVARAGDFIMSKIDARNGAFGIVPSSLDGALVSSDFPVFSINKKIIEPRHLEFIVKSESFAKLCELSSPGTSNRRRIKVDVFLGKSIPSLDKKTALLLEGKFTRIAELNQQVKELNAEMLLISDKLWEE